MKKIFFITLIITACFTMTSCEDFPMPPITPDCIWVNDVSFNFNNISLNMPTNNRFFGIDVSSLITFPEVFSFGSGLESCSNIKITTTVAGCVGTLSKSVSFTGMYDVGLFSKGFGNQNRVSTVEISAHSVVLEITSGPWVSINTGELGTIVWTSNIGYAAYTSIPDLVMDGTFKVPVSKSNILLRVYVDDEFQELQLR